MATDPPGTPVAPCIKFNLELERGRTKEEREREEVSHLFRCYTHTHFGNDIEYDTVDRLLGLGGTRWSDILLKICS